jgi:hypothetical protein
MPFDTDRNRVLLALRDRPEGADSTSLANDLGVSKEIVERSLLYCADYDLATWDRHRGGSGRAVITNRGRDYLVRQGL